MLNDTLEPLRDASPQFVTVTLDVTRRDRASEDDLRLRWREAAAEMERQGVDRAVRSVLEDVGLAPTGMGGDTTRTVVADPEGRVLLDAVLPGRPGHPGVVVGPAPDVRSIVSADNAHVSHVLLRVDRTGADIEVVGPLGVHERDVEVAGDHDVIHKPSAGGWSQRRIQSRVQDSWERNAGQVAERLDAVVRRHRPAVVLAMGDDHAFSALEHHASGAVRAVLTRRAPGGRAPGPSRPAAAAAVREALQQHRAEELAQQLDRLTEQTARQQAGVVGLADVASALGRGQVERLLLRDGALTDTTVGLGTAPTDIRPVEPESASESDGGAMPADVALVWAALSTDAEVTVLDAEDERLGQGVAAILRWFDPATAHDEQAPPSMPGHGEAPGTRSGPE
jgi:hypothetical protein